MTHEILTVQEVALLMRVSADTIYRLAAEGELPGRKVGRAWRFSRAAVSQYLTGAPAETPASSRNTVPDGRSPKPRPNRDTTAEPVTPRTSHADRSGNQDQRQ